VLFASNLYKDFIDVEGVAIALMFSLQLSRICSAELDTPQADRLVAEVYRVDIEQTINSFLTQKEHNTYWINPFVGVVKVNEVYEEYFYSTPYERTIFEGELRSVNFPIPAATPGS
jgi:hypothetical protein